jgi:hypothetical protein
MRIRRGEGKERRGGRNGHRVGSLVKISSLGRIGIRYKAICPMAGIVAKPEVHGQRNINLYFCPSLLLYYYFQHENLTSLSLFNSREN